MGKRHGKAKQDPAISSPSLPALTDEEKRQREQLDDLNPGFDHTVYPQVGYAGPSALDYPEIIPGRAFREFKLESRNRFSVLPPPQNSEGARGGVIPGAHRSARDATSYRLLAQTGPSDAQRSLEEDEMLEEAIQARRVYQSEAEAGSAGDVASEITAQSKLLQELTTEVHRAYLNNKSTFKRMKAKSRLAWTNGKSFEEALTERIDGAWQSYNAWLNKTTPQEQASVKCNKNPLLWYTPLTLQWPVDESGESLTDNQGNPVVERMCKKGDHSRCFADTILNAETWLDLIQSSKHDNAEWKKHAMNLSACARDMSTARMDLTEAYLAWQTRQDAEIKKHTSLLPDHDREQSYKIWPYLQADEAAVRELSKYTAPFIAQMEAYNKAVVDGSSVRKDGGRVTGRCAMTQGPWPSRGWSCQGYSTCGVPYCGPAIRDMEENAKGWLDFVALIDAEVKRLDSEGTEGPSASGAETQAGSC